MSDDWRSNVLAFAVLALVCAVMLWWIAGAEASCEERGGVIVWDTSASSSWSYGECVGP